MDYKTIRQAIENPPKSCLSCLFIKQTHKAQWGSRHKCNLLNRELDNHDFQDRPKDCPYEKKA